MRIHLLPGSQGCRRDDHPRTTAITSSWCERAIEPGYGKWVCPGGFVDRGEEVLTAAIREAREEAGVDIRIDRLLNVYSYPGVAPVIIVYVATMTGGTLACDDECLEVRLFAPDQIPWDELAFSSTTAALREFLLK